MEDESIIRWHVVSSPNTASERKCVRVISILREKLVYQCTQLGEPSSRASCSASSSVLIWIYGGLLVGGA